MKLSNGKQVPLKKNKGVYDKINYSFKHSHKITQKTLDTTKYHTVARVSYDGSDHIKNYNKNETNTFKRTFNSTNSKKGININDISTLFIKALLIVNYE